MILGDSYFVPEYLKYSEETKEETRYVEGRSGSLYHKTREKERVGFGLRLLK